MQMPFQMEQFFVMVQRYLVHLMLQSSRIMESGMVPGATPAETDPKTFAPGAFIDTMPPLDSKLFTDPKGVDLQRGDACCGWWKAICCSWTCS